METCFDAQGFADGYELHEYRTCKNRTQNYCVAPAARPLHEIARSGSAKGKGEASATKKSRQPAASKTGAVGKKGKARETAAKKPRNKKRASDDQIGTQLKAIKGIKVLQLLFRGSLCV